MSVCRMLGLQQSTLGRYMSAAASKSIQHERPMPRPRALPLFGTKLALIAAGSGARLHEYIDKRHQQLGPVFCENLGSEVVFVSDPEVMRSLFIKLEGKYPAHILPEPWMIYNKLYGCKRGLLFMDGEEWYHHRRILNRHLLLEDSEQWMSEPIKKVVALFVDRWTSRAKSGSVTPDMEADFYRLSIDVIVAILFGSKSKAVQSKQYDYLLDLFALEVKKIFQTTTKLYALPASLYARLDLQAWRDFKVSVDTSLDMAKKLVNEILSLESDCGDGLIYKLSKEDITGENLTRVVADFVMAAGDTTSYTLLWTLYLLSKDQGVVTDIREKDDAYINCVLKESMRLYPIAPFLSRILPKDSVVDAFVVKKGTPVVASIYTSGRSEKYFSQPEKFLPFRWNRNDPRKNNISHHVPSASLPFAFGSRSCVGKKIAMLQLREAVRLIVTNFDMTLLNNRKVSAVTSQVLVPQDPISISFSLKKCN